MFTERIGESALSGNSIRSEGRFLLNAQSLRGGQKQRGCDNRSKGWGGGISVGKSGRAYIRRVDREIRLKCTQERKKESSENLEAPTTSLKHSREEEVDGSKVFLLSRTIIPGKGYLSRGRGEAG